jgi:hypothetical protein
LTALPLVLSVHLCDEAVRREATDNPRQDLLMEAEGLLQLGEGNRFFGGADRGADGGLSLSELDAIVVRATTRAAAGNRHGCPGGRGLFIDQSIIITKERRAPRTRMKILLGTLKDKGDELAAFLEPRIGVKPEVGGGELDIEDKSLRKGIRSRHVKTYIKRFLSIEKVRDDYRVLVESGELMLVELEGEEEEEKEEKKGKEKEEEKPIEKETKKEATDEDKAPPTAQSTPPTPPE